jgi:hypothetical protein
MSRVAKRARRRLACRIVVGRQRFSGVILDLSASGMFVQTSAKPRPLEAVGIEISLPGHREPLRVDAEVARLRLVPGQLVIVAQGGVGLRITNAPEAYFAFLRAVLPAGSVPAPESPSAANPVQPKYRVRMSQIGGARSRTVHVRARSAQEAAALAVEAAGGGWKPIETCEVDD